MYRIFREDDELVSIYGLEIFKDGMMCLCVAEDDDPTCGQSLFPSFHFFLPPCSVACLLI